MINLLPPEIKQNFRYAERNVSLVRWVAACVAALIIIAGISSYGVLSIRREISHTDRQISTIQGNLSEAKLTETNAKVIEISNSIKLVEKVLAQEILFSKLLKQMATALPSGTNLTGLNIAQVTGGSGLDVNVDARDYQAATQVQVNLEDPTNRIFAKADIQNITCDNTATTNPNFPCKVTLRAQFADNNPFLFINQKQAKS